MDDDVIPADPVRAGSPDQTRNVYCAGANSQFGGNHRGQRGSVVHHIAAAASKVRPDINSKHHRRSFKVDGNMVQRCFIFIIFIFTSTTRLKRGTVLRLLLRTASDTAYNLDLRWVLRHNSCSERSIYRND